MRKGTLITHIYGGAPFGQVDLPSLWQVIDSFPAAQATVLHQLYDLDGDPTEASLKSLVANWPSDDLSFHAHLNRALRKLRQPDTRRGYENVTPETPDLPSLLEKVIARTGKPASEIVYNDIAEEEWAELEELSKDGSNEQCTTTTVTWVDNASQEVIYTMEMINIPRINERVHLTRSDGMSVYGRVAASTWAIDFRPFASEQELFVYVELAQMRAPT